MDVRLSVIDKRLQKINRIIAVASGKGGVGKSLVASTLALNLSKKGCKVGLLDLDLYGPSSHVILGITDYSFPEEEKGILPHKIDDINFMSIVYFTEDKPAPLRGIDVTNVIIELLSITLVKKSEFLIVSTPSKVAVAAVNKLLTILKELNLPIIGVIENMKMIESNYVKDGVSKMNLTYLGSIDFDQQLENSIGNINRLPETEFMNDLNKIISSI